MQINLNHFLEAADRTDSHDARLRITEGADSVTITPSERTFNQRMVALLTSNGRKAARTAERQAWTQFRAAVDAHPAADEIKQRFPQATDASSARPLTSREVQQVGEFLQTHEAGIYDKKAEQIELRLAQIDIGDKQTLPWLKECADHYVNWRDASALDPDRLMTALQSARAKYFEVDLVSHSYPADVVRSILNAMRNDERTLNLIGMLDEKSLPECVSNLSQLTDLILRNNALRGVPEDSCKLGRLEQLYLSNTGLSDLPAAFGKLKSLQLLDLQSNQLTVFPRVIVDLPELQSLNLGGNRI